MGYKKNEITGYWEAHYSKRHPITRQPVCLRRTRCKTEAEAKWVEKELVAAIERKFHQSVVPTWYELSEEYKEASLNRGLTQKTVDDSHSCLVAHTYKAWSIRLVDSISTNEIRILHSERVGHRSTSHQKNILKFIRAVFEYAVEKGILKSNPTPKLKFRIGDKIKAVLTEKQIEVLLNKAKELNSEWYPHWALALYTGMRNGELYALTWDKVDLDSRKIKVDCSWNNKDGFKSTKSGDDRMVPIAPTLVPMLAELKIGHPDTNFVLPRIDVWDKGGQAKELRMFLTGIGLPRIRFHDLRASWATVMLGKGIEPIKVMYMGGWKDIKTMMVYMRKAGIEIQGITDNLELHNPSRESARVLSFGLR